MLEVPSTWMSDQLWVQHKGLARWPHISLVHGAIWWQYNDPLSQHVTSVQFIAINSTGVIVVVLKKGVEDKLGLDDLIRRAVQIQVPQVVEGGWGLVHNTNRLGGHQEQYNHFVLQLVVRTPY